jgi:hypothetical protein
MSFLDLVHQRDVRLLNRIELRVPRIRMVPRESFEPRLEVRSLEIPPSPGKDFVARDTQLIL